MYNPTANNIALGLVVFGIFALSAFCGGILGYTLVKYIRMKRGHGYYRGNRGIGYLEDDPTLRIISEAKKEMKRKENEP